MISLPLIQCSNSVERPQLCSRLLSMVLNYFFALAQKFQTAINHSINIIYHQSLYSYVPLAMGLSKQTMVGNSAFRIARFFDEIDDETNILLDKNTKFVSNTPTIHHSQVCCFKIFFVLFDHTCRSTFSERVNLNKKS